MCVCGATVVSTAQLIEVSLLHYYTDFIFYNFSTEIKTSSNQERLFDKHVQILQAD